MLISINYITLLIICYCNPMSAAPVSCGDAANSSMNLLWLPTCAAILTLCMPVCWLSWLLSEAGEGLREQLTPQFHSCGVGMLC